MIAPPTASVVALDSVATPLVGAGVVAGAGDRIVAGAFVLAGAGELLAVGAVVVDAPAEVGAGAGVVAAAPPSHDTLAHNDGSDSMVASPGCETPVVHSTALFGPATNVQHGSPSSWPFVWPSPSESAAQSSAVHRRPAASKASPNALRGPPPIVSMWPRASTPATFAPFGKRATNSGRAVTDEVVASASTRTAKVEVERSIGDLVWSGVLLLLLWAEAGEFGNEERERVSQQAGLEEEEFQHEQGAREEGETFVRKACRVLRVHGFCKSRCL